MSRKNRVVFGVFLTVVVIITLTLIADSSIRKISAPYVFSDINQLQTSNTGILLGTSRRLRNGNKNDFFYNRIAAAIELYNNKKIKFIIVSGDNRHHSYNEPRDMKDELVANGIPDSVIYLDYAGFRTFDSMIRAKEVFGQNAFVVISQKFHNERAVFIARQNNIDAIGYNARDVDAFKGFRTKLREYLARDKVFIDILFGVTPKFYGPKIEIE